MNNFEISLVFLLAIVSVLSLPLTLDYIRKKNFEEVARDLGYPPESVRDI